MAGSAGKPNLVAYVTMKHGVVGLTRSAGVDLGDKGIRVNAVLPGLTDTKFASAMTGNPKILNMMMQMIPLARVAQPDEIAPAVLYLASAASSYVTGSVLSVDGGYLA
jgi:NAD(P)-dependent dehydrogenase (short-subunit alcohol dehydrogenase family)